MFKRLLMLGMLIAILKSATGCSKGLSFDTNTEGIMKTEVVMSEGMVITARTPQGTISIEAEPGFDRTYRWGTCSGTVTLTAREERWYGSLGIYGDGDIRPCNGINRIVAEEGQQHFETAEEATEWLNSRKYMQYVHTADGLAIGWRKVAEREQLDVEVWQILLKNRKPKNLAGSNDRAISVQAPHKGSKSALSPARSMICAAEKGDSDMVKELLSRGVDVNAIANDGHTALMAAALEGHTAIVEYLIERGADVRKADYSSKTAVIYATMGGHTDSLRILLRSGGDPNSRDPDGFTVLMLAAIGGDSSNCKLLIEAGADTDAKDSNGSTALMFAASRGRTDVVRLLVEKGADVNVRGPVGNTALEHARAAGYTDIVQILRNAGAID